MKAMIFAAGLGTRLKPITDTIPKALVPVHGKPLLGLVIERLKFFGVTKIIVNVHHFADKVIQFLADNQHFDIRIEISDEREVLLDTGGGLKKAAWFFDDGKPFMVHNVDILSNLNLAEMYQSHQNSDALVTLAVTNRLSSRGLLFDQNKQLCGWQNLKTQEVKWARNIVGNAHAFSFSGIHIISPQIFDAIHQEGKFPIMDEYLRLAAEHSLQAYLHDDEMWMDVGKHDTLDQAEAIWERILVHQQH